MVHFSILIPIECSRGMLIMVYHWKTHLTIQSKWSLLPSTPGQLVIISANSSPFEALAICTVVKRGHLNWICPFIYFNWIPLYFIVDHWTAIHLIKRQFAIKARRQFQLLLIWTVLWGLKFSAIEEYWDSFLLSHFYWPLQYYYLRLCHSSRRLIKPLSGGHHLIKLIPIK